MRKLNSRLGYFVVVKLTAIVRAMFVASMLYLLPGTSTAYALDIVAITMDSFRIPYLLDEHGDVWAFKKAQTLEEPFRLPNLHHITQLAPYIALDDKGHVFTWGLHPIKTSWDESSEVEEPVFLNSKEVPGITGATKIASSGGSYFAAVIGDKGIYDWIATPDDTSFANYSVSNGPLRMISSRTDVVDIDITWTPELIPANGSAVRPMARSVVALFGNGDLVGWGVDSYGLHLLENGVWQEKLLAHLPSATSIYRSGRHMVVLDGGVPRYWGGCNKTGNRGAEARNSLVGVKGYVDAVQQMYINQLNSNSWSSAFKKFDGSLWLAYAPYPSGETALGCGRPSGQLDMRPFHIEGIEIKQMEIMADFVLILDGNHQLWTWDDRAKRLEQVLLNLK